MKTLVNIALAFSLYQAADWYMIAIFFFLFGWLQMEFFCFVASDTISHETDLAHLLALHYFTGADHTT